MTDEVPDPSDAQVIEQARARGFDLVQRELPDGRLVWTWRKADDTRNRSCWLERRLAVSWMRWHLGSWDPYAAKDWG